MSNATNYDQTKREIKMRKFEEREIDSQLEDEWQEITKPRKRVTSIDIAKLGTGVLVGGGLGLLAGVATIAVAASAAEIVIGGVITKVAGVVGGAAGLGFGLQSLDKNTNR
nr:hypothetical protein [Desulfobulbaceae bacterium]